MPKPMPPETVIYVSRSRGRWLVCVAPQPWPIGSVNYALDTAADADAYAKALQRRFGWRHARKGEGQQWSADSRAGSSRGQRPASDRGGR